jgi:hypothetical protein
MCGLVGNSMYSNAIEELEGLRRESLSGSNALGYAETCLILGMHGDENPLLFERGLVEINRRERDLKEADLKRSNDRYYMEWDRKNMDMVRSGVFD